MNCSEIEIFSRLYLPTVDKTVKIKTFTNKEFFNIIKIIHNNDDYCIEQCFDKILDIVVEDKGILNDINNVEKFLILLETRINSIGETISVTSQNEQQSIAISLKTLKNKITNLFDGYNLKKTLTYDNITVKINLPKKMLLYNIDDIYGNVIDSILIDNDEYNLLDSSPDDLEELLQNLPASISTSILNFIKEVNDISSKIYLIENVEKFGYDNVPLNLLNNTLYHFLKNIFSEDLGNFYELMYNMIRKLNFDYHSLMNLTPKECKVFITFYNSDIKKENESQTNGSGSTPRMPSFSKPSIPKM